MPGHLIRTNSSKIQYVNKYNLDITLTSLHDRSFSLAECRLFNKSDEVKLNSFMDPILTNKWAALL